MTKLEALIALNMFLDIGSVRLGRLLDAFGSPENILKAPVQRLRSVFGIGEKIASNITAFNKDSLARELSLVGKLKLKVLTFEDAGYPQNLKNIYDPPVVLYVKGELLKGDNAAIGVVGSRRASLYGLSSAEKLSADLAQRGVTIISGMARGIDTCAHRGALKASGRTIAVIGSGLNDIYPPENIKLADEIAQNGAVVSEFPVNAKPLRQNFPRRNRLISGLSRGVLVVEAARNSGALITSDFALEQGRDVFAVPGRIDSNNSSGTNNLIKQGAKPVMCAEDIIEEYEVRDLAPKIQSSDETVYSILSDEPVDLDTLAEKTQITIGQLSGVILRLQLAKKVRQLPGKQFVRNA